MIHTIKNIKWIISTSLVCISLGVLTFFTFIDESFIKLTDSNLQILLFVDAILLAAFFILIIRETYKILSKNKKGKIGSRTSLKYITFFITTTLLPSVLIAVFSLILFNMGIQQFFNKKIKTVVNNSAEVAGKYVNEIKNSIEADILLMVIDVNRNANLYYDNPNKFLNILTSQRLLRKLDEVHLIDSSGDIIMSNFVDASIDFVPPPDEAFEKSLEGRPIRITDPITNRTSALIKLNNFIDTYLYIVKFIDPKLISSLKETSDAVVFYYSVQNKKSGLKITFAIIYILIVSLLLFLSIIISFNFASRLTEPIINLIGASEKISKGNLNVKVPEIETDYELKKLNENFNSMIDKLKKQQDKLLVSERHQAWETVARKLAHEIKNPLTPIQLSIDRIREKFLSQIQNGKSDLSSYLDTINKQIQDIEYLLNEFSDFARMPKPVLKKINLNNVISRSIELHKFNDSNVSFFYTKPLSSMYVNIDEEQFNRVFINLIKNSIESINEKINKTVDFKGKITVDIRDDSDYIYVTIKDNGVGFDQIDKIRMLTPYFTTKKKGTGLGLAVVSKIISDHNSFILFNSIKNGAKIEITIPKA